MSQLAFIVYTFHTWLLSTAMTTSTMAGVCDQYCAAYLDQYQRRTSTYAHPPILGPEQIVDTAAAGSATRSWFAYAVIFSCLVTLGIYADPDVLNGIHDLKTHEHYLTGETSWTIDHTGRKSPLFAIRNLVRLVALSLLKLVRFAIVLVGHLIIEFAALLGLVFYVGVTMCLDRIHVNGIDFWTRPTQSILGSIEVLEKSRVTLSQVWRIYVTPLLRRIFWVILVVLLFLNYFRFPTIDIKTSSVDLQPREVSSHFDDDYELWQHELVHESENENKNEKKNKDDLVMIDTPVTMTPTITVLHATQTSHQIIMAVSDSAIHVTTFSGCNTHAVDIAGMALVPLDDPGHGPLHDNDSNQPCMCMSRAATIGTKLGYEACNAEVPQAAMFGKVVVYCVSCKQDHT